ncbi:hypothetical protein C8R48DRAFT_772051 [Suillus tomentosus]|nr:hypothetical protein C8R48DRAFT_772051 [Suillus tomentosus]
MQAFTNNSQPSGEIPPNDYDDNSENSGIDLLWSQPQALHGHWNGGQPHASGSTHQSHYDHIPPANVSISRDDASDFQDEYDASTNPYVDMQTLMSLPSPWQIPSQPQVQIPLQLFGYGQLPLPVNHQLQGSFMTPLSPLPPSHDMFAFDVSYPPSNAMHDGQVPQAHDDTTNTEPTPIVPSQAHISFAPPEPYLAEFIPDFTHPFLSNDRSVLLPPHEEDESLRQTIKDVSLPPTQDLGVSRASPEDDSNFRFYRGPNNRRGRKRKRTVKGPHLVFDDTNSNHQRIVKSATREITKNALNNAALTDEADRVALVNMKLEEAAKKVLGTEHGKEWASQNSGTLYMILSEPCKKIMKTCKRRAFELVLDGFQLRLSIWSTDSELEHQETVLADFLDDSVFPPDFLMGFGTDNQRHFLENSVVLNVILDTVRELNLIQYLDDLDSLACLAAVAVRCALERVRHGVSADVEFSGAAFKDLYMKLMTYIEETIKTCPELRERWESYKNCIKNRLAQYQ